LKTLKRNSGAIENIEISERENTGAQLGRKESAPENHSRQKNWISVTSAQSG
jgi:hypothetical protein